MSKTTFVYIYNCQICSEVPTIYLLHKKERGQITHIAARVMFRLGCVGLILGCVGLRSSA